MKNTPLVSIRCFTYNQSRYITQALDGFTMQETSFPYVILVMDDASTDGEQEVIHNYIQENFDLQNISVAYEKDTNYGRLIFSQHKTNQNCYIAAFFLKENHYSCNKDKMPYMAEWRNAVKYEAFCEGDDYWTDSHKLSKQVAYMEQHPECGLCYTDCDIYHEADDSWERSIYKTAGESLNVKNPLLPRKVGYTANMTWLMRMDVLNKIPQCKCYIDEAFFRFCHFCLLSNVDFLPNATGVYRRNVGSASCFDDEKRAFKYTANTFSLFEYLIPKFPNPVETRRQFYDDRLYTIYPKAIKFNAKEIIDAYRSFYPKWFLDIASKEVVYRQENNIQTLSFTYKVARKLLFLCRRMHFAK